MSSQTLNISLPKELVKRTDAVAKDQYKSRSELIRDALRVYVERLERWDRLFEKGEMAAKRAGIKNEEDVMRIIKELRREKRKPQNRY